MRYKKITKGNILEKVNGVLKTLPKSYVYTIDYRKSLGPGNVNIGGTKTELNIKVYDTDLENWTRQPNVYARTFEDSDGDILWAAVFSQFEDEMEGLRARKENGK